MRDADYLGAATLYSLVLADGGGEETALKVEVPSHQAGFHAGDRVGVGFRPEDVQVFPSRD